MGVDAFPSEHLLQMLGEGLLDQAIFAVNVGVSHEIGSDSDGIRWFE
ncbi:MAG: hypothetical protein WCO26_15490 [Deltaproteobacteria bacterium]